MGPTPRHVVLTPRERDIVRGIIAGRTNPEMARALGLNEQSVKNVLSTVYHKCDVRNRLEPALYAVNHRLVDDEREKRHERKKYRRVPRSLPELVARR